LIENLKLTPEERVRNMEAAIAAVEEFRRAGEELRRQNACENPKDLEALAELELLFERWKAARPD
jgi:hypothetical protein